MSGQEQGLQCLICRVPIAHAHMGIDSCRACAAFYKRTLNFKRPIKCKRGGDDCLSEDYSGTRKGVTIDASCRKCRFARFKEIIDSAAAGEIQFQTDSSTTESDGSPQTQAVDEPAFIDHNSYFDCDPSCSVTPLLDRMKRAYSVLCMARKSGEMAAMNRSLVHDLLRQGHETLLPAKYSAMVDCATIFVDATVDFAKSSFNEFKDMPVESQYHIILRNMRLLLSLDEAYRANHHFPHDDTIMASYMTFVNDSNIDQFFDDCPVGINTKEAAEVFNKNIKRTILVNKDHFRKLKPSAEEFVALMGLGFWNDNTSDISSELARLASKNRARIMDELHKMYVQNGLIDYAARLGELLCLLVNVERVLDVTNEDIEVYRMMNLFNESLENLHISVVKASK